VEDKLFMEGQSFAVIGRWVDRAHIEQMIEAGATEVPARELSARLAEGTVDLLLTHRDIISSVDTWTSIGMPLWEALCHPRLRVVVEPSFVDDRLRNHLSPNPRGTRWDFFPHGMLVLTDLASLLGEEGGAEWIEGTLGLLAAVEDAAQALHQARSSRDDIIKGVPSLPRTSTKLGARPWGEHHLKLPLGQLHFIEECIQIPCEFAILGNFGFACSAFLSRLQPVTITAPSASAAPRNPRESLADLYLMGCDVL